VFGDFHRVLDCSKCWVRISIILGYEPILGIKKCRRLQNICKRTKGSIKNRSKANNSTGIGYIHTDGVSRIHSLNNDSSSSKPEVLNTVLQDTVEFIQKSRKERLALTQNNLPAPLYKTRSGKVSFKPLTKKQRNQLQAIPTDTLHTYINNRV